MIVSKSKIRIRYDEVDKMGYVYHGNYAKYYHISRTDLLRKIGISEIELEKYNVLLPVTEMNIKYLKPVFYDDIITIQTSLQKIPTSRLVFYHEVSSNSGEIINRANSTVAFVDINTRKPMKAPQIIIDKIKSYLIK
jgi:acyl-CoA thioester hydrolase